VKTDSTEFLSEDFVPAILFESVGLLMSMMVKLALLVKLVELIVTALASLQSLLKVGYSSFGW
jgi:hypothetical protein